MTALLVYGVRGAPDLVVGTVGRGPVTVQAERGCTALALGVQLCLHAAPYLLSVTFQKWIRAVSALLRKAGSDVAAYSVRSLSYEARNKACKACKL